MTGIFSKFEKYCEKCKKYFASDKIEIERCTVCGEFLKNVLICQTCQRRYTVYQVEAGAKCLTCNMSLKRKYLI